MQWSDNDGHAGVQFVRMTREYSSDLHLWLADRMNCVLKPTLSQLPLAQSCRAVERPFYRSSLDPSHSSVKQVLRQGNVLGRGSSLPTFDPICSRIVHPGRPNIVGLVFLSRGRGCALVYVDKAEAISFLVETFLAPLPAACALRARFSTY